MVQDTKGFHVLHVAALQNREEIARAVCDKIAATDLVNKRDVRKRTALHLAASLGSLGMCKILTAQPTIDVRARDENGLTASERASKRGNAEVARFLETVGGGGGGAPSKEEVVDF